MAGHLVITLPMSYRIVQAVLEGVDFSLLEAARSLGATEWTAVRRVIFPAVAPGLVASALLAFVNSLQNFSMSLMVAPEGFKTLPLDLVGFVFAETGAYSNFNLAAAVSLCMMVLIISALWAVRLITKQTWFENLNF
jgi:ABC-type spermidine/putrescine transport system permease subunit II